MLLYAKTFYRNTHPFPSISLVRICTVLTVSDFPKPSIHFL